MNLVTQIDTKNYIVTFQFRGHSVSASFSPEEDETENSKTIDSCLTDWVFTTFDEDEERWLITIIAFIVRQLRKDEFHVVGTGVFQT